VFLRDDTELGISGQPIKEAKQRPKSLLCSRISDEMTSPSAEWLIFLFHIWMGRAIAQAVSRWFPTAAARVRARVWSCGICGGQSGSRAHFLRVLRFTLLIFVPPITPQSPSSIIWSSYNRPIVAAVPSGLCSYNDLCHPYEHKSFNKFSYKPK
jgi:hypothetical protein